MLVTRPKTAPKGDAIMHAAPHMFSVSCLPSRFVEGAFAVLSLGSTTKDVASGLFRRSHKVCASCRLVLRSFCCSWLSFLRTTPPLCCKRVCSQCRPHVHPYPYSIPNAASSARVQSQRLFAWCLSSSLVSSRIWPKVRADVMPAEK